MNPSSLLLKRLYLLLHFSWLLLLYNLSTSGKSVCMVLLAALYSNMPSNGQTLGYNEFYQVSALQHISGALRVRRSSLFIWHSPVLTCPLSPILFSIVFPRTPVLHPPVLHSPVLHSPSPALPSPARLRLQATYYQWRYSGLITLCDC